LNRLPVAHRDFPGLRRTAAAQSPASGRFNCASKKVDNSRQSRAIGAGHPPSQPIFSEDGDEYRYRARQ
jgi:hypothetical protein